MEYFLSKICPGSWEREVHFSANIKTGSYTRQTTPQFRGGLLLDGQGEEDYTKDSVQNWGLSHRNHHKSNISRSSPVHSWFCWFRSHSSFHQGGSPGLRLGEEGSSSSSLFSLVGEMVRVSMLDLPDSLRPSGVEFIIQFLEEKLKKSQPHFFCGSVIPIKNTFWKKKWPKTVNPALSSDVSILPLTIWGCHCQLDDHHRNPNTNNRDHLVG